jgi:CHU_C Type IX secretion signal domain
MVIDEVAYSANWQFKLITNAEGVAIERIDPDGPSQDRANWHSAASTSGYGTPTSVNSQYLPSQQQASSFRVTPQVFSPDNDGRDDFARIEYKLGETGFMANVTIFDAAGHAVRYLAKNALLATAGQWVWDGLDEMGAKVPIGIYVVFSELFKLDGRKKVYKTCVVVGGLLH